LNIEGNKMETLKNIHKLALDKLESAKKNAAFKNAFALILTMFMASNVSAEPTGIAVVTCGIWDIFVGYNLHVLIAAFLLLIALSAVIPILQAFLPNISPAVAFSGALLIGFIAQWAPVLDESLLSGLLLGECTS
jgi:hypothetical protein